MNGNKSSKHWQIFYNTIEDIQIKCKLSRDIITPEIANYFDVVFFESKLYLIAANAIKEIENKNETSLSIKSVSNHCEKFDIRFKEIRSKNEIVLSAKGSVTFDYNFREGGQLFSGLKTSEKSDNYTYCVYTNVEAAFYKFYNHFKEITGVSGKQEMSKQLNEKIKWLGSPEQFGFIFGELASKGYIELPTNETEGSLSKLAELCWNYFEILSTKGKTAGKQTTIENLERAINPETNQLNIKGKVGLKLPPLKDLK